MIEIIYNNDYYFDHRTLIVEGVSEFVTHNDPDATEVQAAGIFHIVERALKYTGREHYLIFRGRVISVDCGRRHYPRGLVDQLFEFFQIFLKRVLVYSYVIEKILVLLYLQITVALVELVGIENEVRETDHVSYSVRLLVRRCSSLGVHPVKILQILRESRANLVYHFLGLESQQIIVYFVNISSFN